MNQFKLKACVTSAEKTAFCSPKTFNLRNETYVVPSKTGDEDSHYSILDDTVPIEDSDAIGDWCDINDNIHLVQETVRKKTQPVNRTFKIKSKANFSIGKQCKMQFKRHNQTYLINKRAVRKLKAPTINVKALLLKYNLKDVRPQIQAARTGIQTSSKIGPANLEEKSMTRGVDGTSFDFKPVHHSTAVRISSEEDINEIVFLPTRTSTGLDEVDLNFQPTRTSTQKIESLCFEPPHSSTTNDSTINNKMGLLNLCSTNSSVNI